MADVSVNEKNGVLTRGGAAVVGAVAGLLDPEHIKVTAAVVGVGAVALVAAPAIVAAATPTTAAAGGSAAAAAASPAGRNVINASTSMLKAAGGTASATRASSAAQGALLRAQLAAEEVAGARLPQAITGYTRHGLNQAISRDGVGVSTRAIMDAFKNPASIAGQSGGRFVLTGRDAVVVVNAEGKVITTWATNSAEVRVVP
jgi:hypothetical protein